MMSYGERLKKAREEIGYTKTYVAQRMGVHRSTIGKYEKDECEPSADVLVRLIDLYRADANYILFGYGRKSIITEGLPEYMIEKIYIMIKEYEDSIEKK